VIAVSPYYRRISISISIAVSPYDNRLISVSIAVAVIAVARPNGYTNGPNTDPDPDLFRSSRHCAANTC
jgi:hypothetical protein